MVKRTWRRWASSAAIRDWGQEGESGPHGRLPAPHAPALLVYDPLARTPLADSAVLDHINVVGALKTVPEHELQGSVPAPHDEQVASSRQ